MMSLVDKLSSDESGIDIKNVCSRFTADVIGACGFGLECNAMKDEKSEMLRMGEFFDIRDWKTRANFFFVNMYPDVAKKLKLKLTPDFINDFFMRVIKQTYEFRMNNEVTRNDFMSLLMQIHKHGKLHDDETETAGTLTFNELAAQAFIFFAAG